MSGPRKMAQCQTSPCRTCPREDGNPGRCGTNGSCATWRKWFAETWPKAAEKAKLEMKL